MSAATAPIAIADVAAFSAALWFGTALGAFGAVWLAIGHIRWRAIRFLERALQREVASSAARETSDRATIDRLRKQRNDLLSACTDARSALLEAQLEARAREEQIRRQVANSGFGELRSSSNSRSNGWK